MLRALALKGAETKRKNDTSKIYDPFTGYSMADCDCTFCLYYGGKRAGCKASKCCCEEEWTEAMAKEGLPAYG